MGKIVLAGDIGGTKTLLQLAEAGAGGFRTLAERRFDSTAYAHFDTLLRDFMPPDGPAVAAACFGVAGPVDGRRAKVTNLPWHLDSGAIGALLGISRVSLINDFSAVGHGIELLRPEDMETLQAGRPEARGVRAVIGAGTGLGQGMLVWGEGAYRAFPSEGGHVDFAPADQEQADLLAHLRTAFGHVSYERLLSGGGLARLFDFVTGNGLASPSSSLLAALRDEPDRAAVISAHGLEGRDPAAARALDMFIAIYGAQAGNLALTLLARGGVYVAGGIAPKILARLRQGGFMHAFLDKGRFASLLSEIPVHVVTNPRVGLLGALRVAGEA